MICTNCHRSFAQHTCEYCADHRIPPMPVPTPEERAKVADVYAACAAIEGFDGKDHTEEEVIEAFQTLIDDGIVWNLQGFYGRTAANLIERGLCHA